MARKRDWTFTDNNNLLSSREEEHGLSSDTQTPAESFVFDDIPPEIPQETENQPEEIIQDRARRADQAWVREAIRVDAEKPGLAQETWRQSDQARGAARTYHAPRKPGEGNKEKKRKRVRSEKHSFIKNLLIIAVCAVLFLTVALMVLSNFVDHPLLILPRRWVTQVITPVQKTFSQVTESITDYLRMLKVRGTIEAEYEKLLQMVDDYANEAAQLEEYRRTVASLYDLLDEQKRNYDMNPIAATVIGTDAGNYFSTLTLDVGSKNGVEPYMAVISQGGLVGVTYEVEDYKCQVRCIISSDCTVSALIQSTRDQGSIKGTLGINGEPMCRMYYLPDNAIARPGDVIVTSGVGLEFPKGIPIGEVRESTRGMEDNKSYVVVDPIVDFQHLEYVTVYRYKPAYAEAAQSRVTGTVATLEPLSTPRAVPTFQIGSVSDFIFSATEVPEGHVEETPAPETTPSPTPAPTPSPDPNATPLPENLSYNPAVRDDTTPTPSPRPTPTPSPTPMPTQDIGNMTVEED